MNQLINGLIKIIINTWCDFNEAGVDVIIKKLYKVLKTHHEAPLSSGMSLVLFPCLYFS